MTVPAHAALPPPAPHQGRFGAGKGVSPYRRVSASGAASKRLSARGSEAGPCPRVVTSLRYARVAAAEGGGWVVETLPPGGSRWSYEVAADQLDEAIERAARCEVEARFREAHSRMPIDERTALVYVRGRWALETRSAFRGERSRGRTWPSVYRALCSARAGGVRSHGADPYRRALVAAHLATVAALRERLPAELPGGEGA